MKQELSFEINQRPVLFNINGEILTSTTHQVISRSDNNDVLSVMKNSYKPMMNSDFQESTERMAEISGFKFSGYSEFNNGRIVISHLKNDGSDGGLKIGGHDIKDYLILGSSFDGSKPFFIGTTTDLLRCKNQFSRITQMEKVRHTASSPKRRDELMRSLEFYFKNRNNLYQQFEKMQEIKIDAKTKALAMDYFLSVSKEDRLAGEVSTKKLNALDTLAIAVESEMMDLGQNLWGLFNGATKYTTHSLKQNESVFGNVFGNASFINDRAFHFAQELMVG